MLPLFSGHLADRFIAVLLSFALFLLVINQSFVALLYSSLTCNLGSKEIYFSVYFAGFSLLLYFYSVLKHLIFYYRPT